MKETWIILMSSVCTMGVIADTPPLHAQRAAPPLRPSAVAVAAANNDSVRGAPSQTFSRPDLTIATYDFLDARPHFVKVRVANRGTRSSAACRLRITFHEIKGTQVKRIEHAAVPALKPRASTVVYLDASGVLPQKVRAAATCFRLWIDSQQTVAESNEANNYAVHATSADK